MRSTAKKIMLTRILTAIVGISLGIVVLFLADTIVFNIVIAAFSVMIVYELFSNCKCLQYKLDSAVCFIFAGALPFLTQYCGTDIIYVFAVLCIMVMFVGFIMNHKKMPYDKLCFMIASTVLPSMALCCVVRMKNYDPLHGVCYVVICLAAAWLSDGAAYFVGTFFGKHKLCPEISPKKTIEGAVGGVLVGALILVAYIFAYQKVQAARGYDFEVNYILAVVIGIVSGLLSIVGDLSASLIKRQNDIKDFGHILPGHGGILDRFDSVLFVAPFLAFILEYFKLFY